MNLTLLGRQACHLCDKAADALAALRDEFHLVVTSVDIDGHDDLVRDFGVRIPVVLGPDGEVLAEGIVTEAKLAMEFGRLCE
ncbi:hypothetical protein BMS3Abin02_00153 [bacterium BMS3Abin02]|nr:hypothetical protein BMS3Abin02_00153 [bacterium BMS3Abin02]GBE21512.1 hypothetical protein BMS3Bbin01_00857 [bacterium BMS3Bbin01]HDH24822.1 glutaredoxin family protein [Actinomycetota bacterium]HDL49108.1 glutaredoxin family protein [Actinomycetota bacterium]